MRAHQWIRQKNEEENILAVIKNLLLYLKVRATDNYLIGFLKGHPDRRSLAGIGDTLSKLRIKNMAVQIRADDLLDINFPSIAHMRRKGGSYFVMLHGLRDGMITYINTEKGWVKEPVSDFVKKWTGIILLSEANEDSGEDDYKKHKFEERMATLRLPFIIFLSSALLITSVSMGAGNHGNILHWLPLLLIKLLGSIVCVLLLIQSINHQNPLVNRICNWGTGSKKLNCQGIIDSLASRVFSWLSWSEIGAFYFVGGLFTLLLSLFGLSLEGIQWFYTAFNLLALPFTFYSVYYQARVKQWCTLCLFIQVLLWVEFALLLNMDFVNVPRLAMTDLNAIVLGYLLPVIFWVAIKPGYMLSQQVKPLQHRLNRFEKNPELLMSILRSSRPIEGKNMQHEFMLGNQEAPNKITMVISLFCGPCGKAFEGVRKLLETYPKDLKVVIIFSLSGDETAYNVAEYILNSTIGNETARAMHLIGTWYEKGKEEGVEKWMKNNPVEIPGDHEKSMLLLENHTNWCKTTGIKKTPTVFINGYELPEGFQLGDIELFLNIN